MNKAKKTITTTAAMFLPLALMLAQSGKIQQRSAELAEKDPYGWIMTITAVAVVFSALIILAVCYNILGYYNGGKGAEKIAAWRKARAERKANRQAGNQGNPEVAAAIAMALKAHNGGETEAAIACALHLYLSETVHDRESYVLTIRRGNSQWNAKGQNFRMLPERTDKRQSDCHLK